MKIIKTEIPQHKTIEIYPFADVHEGDPLQDFNRKMEFIKEVKSERNRYVIVNGDVINNATKNSHSDVYSEKLTPNQQIDSIVGTLAPIKDRIIAITEGNHEKRSYKESGILIMYQVAKRLEIFDKYSEGAYILFITVGEKKNKKTFTLYGKHGAGGGKRPGAKANRLEDMMMVVDADIYLHSHTHLPFTMKKSFYRTDYRTKKIIKVNKLFINTNAFLDYGGYGEEKGYSPLSTHYPKIILNEEDRLIKAVL